MWVFVSNLACTTTEQELRTCFEAYGTVEIVWMTTDENTGRPMGCVKMPNGAEAQAGIAGLNGASLGGQPVTVARSLPDPLPPGDDASRAGLAKPPLSGAWLLPDPHGCGPLTIDPAIARKLAISFDPPDVPHPVRDELGIPLERHLFFVILTDPLGQEGSTYELVGTDPPPELSGAEPLFTFPNLVMPHMPHISSLELFSLVAYSRRITYSKTLFSLEVRWRPDYGETIRLDRSAHIPPKTAYAYEATALKLLQAVEKRGRPPDTRYYIRDKFHAAYLEADRDALRKRGLHRTDQDRARALGISPSTIKRYLREYGRPPLP